jgi:WD40 repeat protein
VTSLSFSADSAILASGSYDSTIIVWSMKDGSILQKINHGDKVRATSVSGNNIASGGNDKLVKLWDAKTGKSISTFRGLTDRVYCIEFSQNGGLVAAGGNNELIIWNAGSGKTEHHLLGDVAPYPRFGTIKAIAFNPNGKDADGYICAFSCLSGIAMFNPQNKEVSIIRDTSMPGSVTYSPSGSYIAWGARHQHSENTYFPRLLKVSSREMDPEIYRNDPSAAADRVFYTAYAPGGRQLIMLSYGQAVLFDIKTGSIIRKFSDTSTTSVTAAALSPDGKIFAAASGNNIRLWAMD